MSRYIGLKRYNDSKKLSLNDIKPLFDEKGYSLITKEYINNKQDLDFTCNSHMDLGIQKTTVNRLRKILHNCIECQKEYNKKLMIDKVRNLDAISTYKDVLSGKIKTFPNGFFLYRDLNSLLGMLNYYLELVKTKEKTNNIKIIMTHEMFKKYKLSALLNFYSIYEIINLVLPNKYKPWELSSSPPYYWQNKNNVKEACTWFYRKLYEDEIICKDIDILAIKSYGELFKKYNLDGLFYTKFNSSHYRFWDYLFPSRWYEWEFALTAKNYWKSKENRLNALRQLIENKLYIGLDEIVEKVTYGYLVKNHRKFSAICDIYYNSRLSDWIMECYPNRFKTSDFYLNIADDGTKLDSKSEVKIHNIFYKNNLDIQYFENKIANMHRFYNKQYDESYVPDWILENKIIVEFYGWYNKDTYGKHEVITRYMDKANRKNLFYRQLSNYLFIDIYPKDLENNFDGMITKFNAAGINLVV